MKFTLPHFWEPEETVGSAWHHAVAQLGAEPRFSDATVPFEGVKTSVGVLFRALGGGEGVEIVPLARSVSRHRLSFRRRLAQDVDHVTRADFDGQRLALPAEIALYESHDDARQLYLWLAALCATIVLPFPDIPSPVRRDIARLRAVHLAERRLIARYPGFAPVRRRLAAPLLAARPMAQLPPAEAAIESAIRALLAEDAPTRIRDNPVLAAILSYDPRDPLDAGLDGFAPPPEYRGFRPVALWPMLEAPRIADTSEPDAAPQHGGGAGDGPEKSITANRRASDQAERRDSLILHRFESIMSWVEFLNINRAVEDEDEDMARKAAEDLDEVTLARHSKTAKTKLKFHLDLAPRDLDRTRLIGEKTYPEWDHKKAVYLPDHAKVEERIAEEKDEAVFDQPRARRRIAAVKRQFEALRPRRRIVHRQPDGVDLDLDEVIRARCDLLASGDCADRLYTAVRNSERDLAVAVLIDVSRSTESAVAGRPVIDVAREALVALIGGIEACGDAISVHAFSSLRRQHVLIEKIKDFDEPDGTVIRRRIAGLTPKFYTRLGAALRHVSAQLEARPAQRRLLLVITDGKPNDLDHYEGRHGIEDTRRAVQEARRRGQAVFAVTVDAKAADYVPYLFGRNGFAIVPNPERLVEALPDMYRHVLA